MPNVPLPTDFIDDDISGRPLSADFFNTLTSRVNSLDESVDTISEVSNEALDLAQSAQDESKRANSAVYTSGTGTAYTAFIDGFELTNRIMVQVVLHVDMLAGATLNINNSGGKPIYTNFGEPITPGMVEGSAAIFVYNQEQNCWYTVGGVGSSNETSTEGDSLLSATEDEHGKFYYGDTIPTGTTPLNYSGYLTATRIYGAYLADYAEYFNATDNPEPGDIVRIDDSDCYVKASKCGDPRIVGVVSDSFYQCIGHNPDKNNTPIALAGKVRVKLFGKCIPGDYVVSSEIPGVGRIVTADSDPPRGSVLGQVLEYKNIEDISRVLMLVKVV